MATRDRNRCPQWRGKPIVAFYDRQAAGRESILVIPLPHGGVEGKLGIEPVRTEMRRDRLQSYGHVRRKVLFV